MVFRCSFLKKKKGKRGGPSNPGGLKLFMHFLLNVYTPPRMDAYTMNIDAHVYKSMWTLLIHMGEESI